MSQTPRGRAGKAQARTAEAAAPRPVPPPRQQPDGVGPEEQQPCRATESHHVDDRRQRRRVGTTAGYLGARRTRANDHDTGSTGK